MAPQIGKMTERARKTNHLIAGSPKVLTPLLGRSDATQDRPRAATRKAKMVKGQYHRARNFPLRRRANQWLFFARPALIRRGGRVVTIVERGMRWTPWRRRTSGANADGEVVWS